MADVQLEHGHVRVANRLAEALLDAQFSGVQFKLLHALIRLTYGWRRMTVTLSQTELAGYMHASNSGTFRDALKELIAEGVVLEVVRGVGKKPSTYAVEKDFTRWGRFEVGAGRLARIYGQRPASDDGAMSQSSPPKTGEHGADDESSTPPVSGADGTPPVSGTVNDPARFGQSCAPETGGVTGSKSFDGETVGPRKDSRKTEDREEQQQEPLVVEVDAIARLVVAANQGLADHETSPQPIPRILVGQASAREAAETILAAGVPLPFATATLYALAKGHRARPPINSLGYFAQAVVTAWAREQAAGALGGARPGPDPRSLRNGSDRPRVRAGTEMILE